jgi:hypothetical protein
MQMLSIGDVISCITLNMIDSQYSYMTRNEVEIVNKKKYGKTN